MALDSERWERFEPLDPFIEGWLAAGWPWPPQEKHIAIFQQKVRRELDKLR